MRGLPLIAVAMLTVSTNAATNARANDAPRLETRVVSNVKAVRAGEPFTLGVLIEIPQGFHLYWKGTEGGGLPTTLELTLPPGFKASEVAYPTPERFATPATTLVGYEHSVLLAATVTPPADLAGVSSVTIGVNVGWLCCDKERCVPGDAELSFAAPVSNTTTPDANGKALLATWNAKLPAEVSKDSGYELEVASGLARGAKKGRIEATLSLPHEAQKAELFPAAPGALDVSQLSARASGRTIAIGLDAAILEGEALASESIEVVVAYETKSGERKGVRLSVPLRH